MSRFLWSSLLNISIDRSCPQCKPILNVPRNLPKDERRELKRKPARSQFCLLTTPNALIIVLKRFTQDQNGPRKNGTKIRFPIKDLDIRKYLAPDLQKDQSIKTLYDLYGVVNQTGDLGSGHYFAYARQSGGSKTGNQPRFSPYDHEMSTHFLS